MTKKKIEEPTTENDTFFNLKSYSVNEILAAGGTTAFANKLGKRPEDLPELLKRFPKDSFLTEEEFANAMETLNSSK